MTPFVQKRLQVFVSSTFTDLTAERRAAVEAILTAGHIPAGMESFASGNQSQMDVIRHWIEESDVFLLILGARYGSIDPGSGKSYTHLEYEHAISVGMPAFFIVLKESEFEQRVVDAKHEQLLRSLREEVMSRMVSFWCDEKDIKITVGQNLAHLARRKDLIGWIRGDQQVTADMAKEITRLSSENADLRSRISQQTQENAFNGFSFDDLCELLNRKHLIEVLDEKRSSLATRFAAYQLGLDTKVLAELAILGIVRVCERDGGTDLYELSDLGRRFISMRDLAGRRFAPNDAE